MAVLEDRGPEHAAEEAICRLGVYLALRAVLRRAVCDWIHFAEHDRFSLNRVCTKAFAFRFRACVFE